MLKKITAGAALVAVIGLVATAAYVLGTGSSASNDAPVVASAPSAPSEGVPSQNIQVHGRWTIEVADPDGSVVGVSEIDNALVSVGKQHLAKLLARTQSVGDWQVLLTPGSSGGTSPCVDASGAAAGCTIYEGTPPVSGPHTFTGLTVDAPAGSIAKTVLSGTATAGADGVIGQVLTSMRVCDSTVAPAGATAVTCGTPLFTGFSGTTLSASDVVSVVAGQSINVTVVYTFQ